MNEFDPQAIAEDYVLSHDVTPQYQRNLEGTARRYQDSLAKTDDPWSYPAVNRYLAKLRSAKKSPVYVNSCRRHLIILWRHATDCDLASEPIVRRIRIAKVADRRVRTFDIDEVRLILEAAHKLEGNYRELYLSRAAYWSAWIRAKWDTGLRHNDLRAIRRDDVRDDGSVLLCQSKTGRSHIVQFSPETLEAIAATLTSEKARRRSLVFPWPYNHKTFWRHGCKIIEAAGLTGNMKMLRASAGTAYENAHPGQGHVLLGNDRRTFLRNYRDLERITDRRPLPPGL